MKAKLFLLVAAGAFTTGCIPILLNGAMHEDAAQKSAYSSYVTGMASVNSQREADGLTNLTVLAYNDWRTTIWYHGNPPTPVQTPRH